MLFRAEHVLKYNRDLLHEINNAYYRYPASLPPMTWLSDTLLTPLDLRQKQQTISTSMESKDPTARLHTMYRTDR